MSARYYLTGPLTVGHQVVDGPEAHHLLHVMRTQVGDQVVLFDGLGAEAEAVVIALDRRAVTLEVDAVRQCSLELSTAIHLAVALPKGDRQRWLVEKCVELGVSSLTPLTSAHSVAQPTDKAMQRLQRAVIEASKQCGRNLLMLLASSCSLETWLRTAPSSASRWIAHPTNEASRLDVGGAEEVYLTVGPEGGFDPQELELARQCQWQCVSLGPRILRVETAALALAVICGAADDEQ